MDDFNWKSTFIFKTTILILKVAGLWPKDDENYKCDTYMIWAIIALGFLTFANILILTIQIFLVLDDLEAFTSIVSFFLSQLLGLLKAYYVVLNMDTLKRFMATINDDMFRPRNARQRRKIESSVTFWKVNYVFYWLLCLMSGSFRLCNPFFDNSSEERLLPFMLRYPFDTQTSPNYELMYVYQIVGLAWSMFPVLGVDSLIAALSLYTGAQIDILCDELRHLRGRDFNAKLAKCVEHHKEILRLAEQFNYFSNWILFYQFFISSTAAGITLFQITVIPPFNSIFMAMVTYEMAVVNQIFMYCWFGNEVEEKSRLLSYALFESDWTDAPMEAKKNMIFFMLRAQKPISMSALNMFKMSMETFVAILRTAWSYFTLLHQVSSTDE